MSWITRRSSCFSYRCRKIKYQSMCRSGDPHAIVSRTGFVSFSDSSNHGTQHHFRMIWELGGSDSSGPVLRRLVESGLAWFRVGVTKTSFFFFFSPSKLTLTTINQPAERSDFDQQARVRVPCFFRLHTNVDSCASALVNEFSYTTLVWPTWAV